MFDSTLCELVYLRTYARWIDHLQRREKWPETVDRYVSFMTDRVHLTDDEIVEIRNAILNWEVMPSMRLLQFAGEAVARQNAVAYNYRKHGLFPVHPIVPFLSSIA